MLTWYIKSCNIGVSLDHLLLAAFGEQQASDAGLAVRPRLVLDLSADRRCKSLWRLAAHRELSQQTTEGVHCNCRQVDSEEHRWPDTSVPPSRQGLACRNLHAEDRAAANLGAAFGHTSSGPSPAAPLGVYPAALGLHILCDGLQQALRGGPVEHAQH